MSMFRQNNVGSSVTRKRRVDSQVGILKPNKMEKGSVRRQWYPHLDSQQSMHKPSSALSDGSLLGLEQEQFELNTFFKLINRFVRVTLKYKDTIT